ncbi:SET domain-containing protein [Pseudoneobacillus sp. C159]
MSSIFVKDTEKYGQGIFAARPIKKGERFEISPVIIFSKEEWEKHLKETKLYNYVYYWREASDYMAIALGYGSLFNHSYTPNAIFFNNMIEYSIDFYALQDIKAGEEITINYNGDPEDQSPLWFEVIK